MNNYQNKAREEILDIITVRCKDCHRIMDQMKTATAFYCVYCDREFSTYKGVAVHIGWEHGRKQHNQI